MSSYNQVTLVGNLTRDPDFKRLNGDTVCCEIGLAVNERVKRAGEYVDEPVFVDVTLWGRTAEVARDFTSRGKQVLIGGRLKLETWEKDGQKRSKLKVTGERLVLLGSAEGRQASAQGAAGSGQAGMPGWAAAVEMASAPADDDIPF